MHARRDAVLDGVLDQRLQDQPRHPGGPVPARRPFPRRADPEAHLLDVEVQSREAQLLGERHLLRAAVVQRMAQELAHERDRLDRSRACCSRTRPEMALSALNRKCGSTWWRSASSRACASCSASSAAGSLARQPIAGLEHVAGHQDAVVDAQGRKQLVVRAFEEQCSTGLAAVRLPRVERVLEGRHPERRARVSASQRGRAAPAPPRRRAARSERTPHAQAHQRGRGERPGKPGERLEEEQAAQA